MGIVITLPQLIANIDYFGVFGILPTRLLQWLRIISAGGVMFMIGRWIYYSIKPLYPFLLYVG